MWYSDVWAHTLCQTCNQINERKKSSQKYNTWTCIYIHIWNVIVNGNEVRRNKKRSKRAQVFKLKMKIGIQNRLIAT